MTDKAQADESPRGRPQGRDVASVLELDAQGWREGFAARRRIWFVVAAIGMLAAAAVVWIAFGGAANGVRYVVQKASRGDLTVVVTATGTVQPTNKVDVSSELSGIVRKVFVDFNSPVKVNQPLAELDTDKLDATVQSSRAKLAASRARVKDAEATVLEKRLDFDRKKALVVREVTTPRDLEAAKAALDRAIASLASAKADVGAAEADLELNETILTKACICSPIDGIVLQRNVEPGQTVASSFQAPVLFTIAEDLRKMEVLVDVDEADVGKVSEGQDATFTVDAYPDRKFDARIREVRLGSEVVQGVVTYKAVLLTDNSDMLLRPGMTATAEITVQMIKDALTVPNAALRFTPPTEDDSAQRSGLVNRLISRFPRFRRPSRRQAAGPERTLWVLEDGNPVAVSVSVGATDGRRTQIVNGPIAPGQEIIVDAVQTGK